MSLRQPWSSIIYHSQVILDPTSDLVKSDDLHVSMKSKDVRLSYSRRVVLKNSESLRERAVDPWLSSTGSNEEYEARHSAHFNISSPSSV